MIEYFDDLALNESNDLTNLYSIYKEGLCPRIFVYEGFSGLCGADVTDYTKSLSRLNTKIDPEKLNYIKTEINFTLDIDVAEQIDPTANELFLYNGFMRSQIFLEPIGDGWDLASTKYANTKIVGGSIVEDTNLTEQMLFKGRIKEPPTVTANTLTYTFQTNPEKITTLIYSDFDRAVEKKIGQVVYENMITYVGSWCKGSYEPDYIFVNEANTINETYLFNSARGFLADLDKDDTDEFYRLDESYNIVILLLLLAGYTEADIGDSILSGTKSLPFITNEITEQIKIEDILNDVVGALGIILYQNERSQWEIINITPSMNYKLKLTEDNFTFKSIKPYMKYDYSIQINYFKQDGEFKQSYTEYDKAIEDAYPYSAVAIKRESDWLYSLPSVYSAIDFLKIFHNSETYLIEIEMDDLGIILEAGDIIQINYNGENIPLLLIKISKDLLKMKAQLSGIYIKNEFEDSSNYAKLSPCGMIDQTETQTTTVMKLYKKNRSIDLFIAPGAAEWYTEYIFDSTKFIKGDIIKFIELSAGGEGYTDVYGDSFEILKVEEKTDYLEITLTTAVSNANLIDGSGHKILVTCTEEQGSLGYLFSKLSSDSTLDTGEGYYWV